MLLVVLSLVVLVVSTFCLTARLSCSVLLIILLLERLLARCLLLTISGSIIGPGLD